MINRPLAIRASQSATLARAGFRGWLIIERRVYCATHPNKRNPMAGRLWLLQFGLKNQPAGKKPQKNLHEVVEPAFHRVGEVWAGRQNL
jgi:hypothetical protein